MDIQIQALIDGEYVTIVDSKSYHKDLKYSPAFEFDAVETDDIRILYTRGNGTFANLKELEIYSPNGKIPMFEGLGQMADLPTFLKYPEDLNNPPLDDGEPEAPNNNVNGDANNNADDNNTSENDNDNTVKTVIISVACAFGVLAAVVVALIIIKRKKSK